MKIIGTRIKCLKCEKCGRDINKVALISNEDGSEWMCMRCISKSLKKTIKKVKK